MRPRSSKENTVSPMRDIADSDGQSLVALAETYDPEIIARWGAFSIKPNPELARALYEKASLRGVQPSGDRLVAAR